MAEYYIDPDWTGTESGTEAEPYSTWPVIAGLNTYLQKKGTTANEMVQFAQLDGVTLGSYGTGADPIIDAELTREYCIDARGCEDLTISNFNVKNAIRNNLRVYTDATSGKSLNIALTDIESSGCTISEPLADTAADGTGVLIHAKSNVVNGLIDNVTLTRVISHNNDWHGIDIRYHVTNVSHVKCKAYANGGNLGATTVSRGGHGFTSHPSVSTALSGWTDETGGVYSLAEGANDIVVRIIDLVADNLPLTNIEESATPAEGQWSTVAKVLYVHLTGGVTPNTGDGIYLVRREIGPIEYIDCESYSCVDFTGIEGHGFSVDNAAYGVTHTRCKSYSNEGDGFHTRRAGNVNHTGCLSYNNNSHGFADDLGNVDLTKSNCTADGNTVDGFHFSKGRSHICINSISTNNDRGMWADSGNVNQNIDNNNTFGNTTSELVNIATGSNTNVDPLFISTTDYNLQSTSPCVGTGVQHWGNEPRPDTLGDPLPDRDIDIGAYQSTHSPLHPKNI